MYRSSLVSKGLMAAVLAVCGMTVHAADKVTVQLKWLPQAQFAGYYVAQAKGYYKAEGLDVKFVTGRGGVDVAKQVGAGNAVIGGALGDTPIIARAQGIPVKVVAVLGAGSLMQLVSHKDEHIESPRELKGKTVTGFANVEEDFADNAVWSYGLLPRDQHVMPWRIEDRLKALGANFVQAGLWRGFAVRDGNLVTGQQNFSGEETARAVIAALGQ